MNYSIPGGPGDGPGGAPGSGHRRSPMGAVAVADGEKLAGAGADRVAVAAGEGLRSEERVGHPGQFSRPMGQLNHKILDGIPPLWGHDRLPTTVIHAGEFKHRHVPKDGLCGFKLAHVGPGTMDQQGDDSR